MKEILLFEIFIAIQVVVLIIIYEVIWTKIRDRIRERKKNKKSLSWIMKELRNNLDKNGSKVEFYEDMYRSGKIKKDGSAYERLQSLRGTAKKDKDERLKKFLNKYRKDKKNGS